MTGTRISSEGLDRRRRKVLFRAWHRGTREMDLLLGTFADFALAHLSPGQLDLFEALIDVPDHVLLGWLTGVTEPPADHDTIVLRAVRSLHLDGETKAGRILIKGQ